MPIARAISVPRGSVQHVFSPPGGSESCAQPRCQWPRRRAKNALRYADVGIISIPSTPTSRLFLLMNRYVGNLAPTPGLFPDYKAPIIRTGVAGRELVTARWGMPYFWDADIRFADPVVGPFWTLHQDRTVFVKRNESADDPSSNVVRTGGNDQLHLLSDPLSLSSRTTCSGWMPSTSSEAQDLMRSRLEMPTRL